MGRVTLGRVKYMQVCVRPAVYKHVPVLSVVYKLLKFTSIE